MPSSFFKKLQNMVEENGELEDIEENSPKEEVLSSQGAPVLEDEESTQNNNQEKKAIKEPIQKKRKAAVKKTAAKIEPEPIKNNSIQITTTQLAQVQDNKTKEEELSLRERIREIPSLAPSVHENIQKTPELQKPVQQTTIKSSSKKWPEREGQLAVDVYETETDLVIQSAIAGMKPEDIDIDAQGDTVIIRGKRENIEKGEKNYFTKECYWGIFSKEIIMPVEADASRAEANLINGILTIRVPKIGKDKKSKIIIK